VVAAVVIEYGCKYGENSPLSAGVQREKLMKSVGYMCLSMVSMVHLKIDVNCVSIFSIELPPKNLSRLTPTPPSSQ
jgi:hypothetical protein